MEVTAVCRHCRNPVFNGDIFCCAGCEGVYSLLHSLRISEFYEKLGQKTLNPAEMAPLVSIEWDSPENRKYVFKHSEKLERTEFFVDGFNCAACAWLFERVPFINPKIKSASANLALGKVTVTFDAGLPLSEIAGFFLRLGFSLSPWKSETENRVSHEKRIWLTRIAVAGASAIATMHVSLTLYAALLGDENFVWNKHLGVVSFFLAAPAVAYSAVPFFKNAWLSIIHKNLSVDLMASVSILVGMAASVYNTFIGKNEFYYDAVTMLIAALLVGRMIVYYLTQTFVNRQKSFPWEEASEARLQVGEIVGVLSGQIIPADGIVISGRSQLDVSWLTGEEMLVIVGPGDKVWAGSSHFGDKIELLVSAIGAQTRAGQILNQLHRIEKSRSVILSQKIETLLLGAILVLIAGIFLRDLSLHQINFSKIVSILMITCPCALGLAVPSIVAAAMNQGVRRGLFIKDGEVFERINEVSKVIFDKTGTLTAGTLGVKNETWNESNIKNLKIKREELERVIASAVRRSVHPKSRSLQNRFIALKGIDIEVEEKMGMGLSAKWGTRDVLVGSGRFSGVDESSGLNSASPSLHVSVDGLPVASFFFENDVRTKSKETLEKIRQDHSVLMLSGDNASTVLATAEKLGLGPEEVISDASPEEKLNVIESQTKNALVMMVGDGINDQLAMKRSHVSVAISGPAGASLEHCDVYMKGEFIERLEELFVAAKKVRSRVFFNFAWVFLFNLVGISLALWGMISPIICAVIMPLSSIMVILTATTTRYFPEGG